MHTPGVCGAILATGRPTAAEPAAASTAESRSGALGRLVDALADTDMVFVALGDDAEALAPVVWARAAYVVQMAPGASNDDALRALLQEVLSRGRDAALVTRLDGPALSAETVRRMMAVYRAAGEEIWAVASEPELAAGHPVLLGREMLDLFLRGRKWSTAEEILSANRQHVRALNTGDPESAKPATVIPGS
jgi:CTP:molybdopterin cytidylyltransferase MocA